MSISDNEDLDKKPSAKKTTEDSPSSSSTNNNSRRTQKRGLNNNWSSSDDNDEKAGIRGRGGRSANIVHKNLRLSYDDQVDVSYRRTALLLRGGGGSGSVGEKKNEIIIMPSLVSLSDDFFNNSITPSNIENDVDVMDSGDEMEESPETVSSENNFDSSSNNSSNVAGVPRLRPRSLRDSQREQAGRALAAMFAENNNGSRNNDSSGSSSSVARPREDWPIGPQGAQVPSYLLYPRQDDGGVMVTTGNSSNNNNNGSGGNEGGEQQSTLGGQLSSSSTSTNNLLMMDTDTTTNTPNTPPRVAAAAAAAQLPGQSNQDSPQRSAARRVREIMTRSQLQQHQSPSSSSLQHQQRAPSNQYINTAQSLEFALNRLEERLRQLDNHEKEHNSNQNEDVVEAHMLTELAEIMLHPPTDVINGTYCWKGDDEGDNKKKGGDHEEGVTMSSTLLSATTDDTNIVDLSSSNGQMVGGGNNYDACNKQDDDDETKDVMMMQEEDDDGDDVSPRLPAIATTLLINQNTPRHYSTLQSAKQSITSIGKSCPTRRVCQHPFRRNDIVWVCRTCQSDETCVLCHDCFSNSDHSGHDVAFYHAQAGGCCDCGDADAWDPKG